MAKVKADYDTALNRTILELKYYNYKQNKHNYNSLNRTILELKLIKEIERLQEVDNS